MIRREILAVYWSAQRGRHHVFADVGVDDSTIESVIVTSKAKI